MPVNTVCQSFTARLSSVHCFARSDSGIRITADDSVLYLKSINSAYNECFPLELISQIKDHSIVQNEESFINFKTYNLNDKIFLMNELAVFYLFDE
jgi:hypothetical protein